MPGGSRSRECIAVEAEDIYLAEDLIAEKYPSIDWDTFSIEEIDLI